MPKAKKIVVTYYNTNNLPNDAELKIRQQECNKEAEKVLLLFELNKQLTPWEAFRKYKEIWPNDVQKIAIAARIRGLCDQGILYKSTTQVREEKGALNHLYKLKPENGVIDDSEAEKVYKLVQHVYYNPDNSIDLERVRNEFETKLQNIINNNNNVR